MFRGLGLGAEAVHDLHVVVGVFAFAQIQGAGELLEVDNICQVGSANRKMVNAPPAAGVTAAAQRQDLHDNVRPSLICDEVLELGAHHLRPAEGRRSAASSTTAHSVGRAGAGEQLLAGQPQPHPQLDLPGGRGAAAVYQ